MTFTIAIQPDNYTNPRTPELCDAASPRWTQLLQQAGCRVKAVDVRRPDVLEQLRDCDGFMWRWAHFGGMGKIARRLLPTLERYRGLCVYPDQATCWHYDDKIAQSHLFDTLNIPTPKTWVWFDAVAAKQWLREEAMFPLVLKLAGGAGSSNVRLVHDADEAAQWVDLLFRQPIESLKPALLKKQTLFFKLRTSWHWVRYQCTPYALRPDLDPQSHYVFFQEFLPENAFDTRLTVVGNRIFAYRRFNRPNDFRASGSGNFDPNPQHIAPDMLRLAAQTAQALGSQTVAIDGLRRGGAAGQPVVGEVSYTYVSWMVHACPGHWEWQGSPATAEFKWVQGQRWSEEFQVADFLQRLRQRQALRIAA